MDLLIQFKRYLLQDKVKHSRATVKNYLADIRKFINWFEATFHKEFIPHLISTQLAEIYKKEISKPNSQNQVLSARSIKRYLSSLRKFYSFLMANNLASENPFEIKVILETPIVDEFHLKEFKNHLVLSHVSKITIKNYMMDVAQFANWAKNLPEKVILSSVTPFLIEEYKNRLLFEAKFAPVSVNRKLSSLRKYFFWAENEGFIKNSLSFDQVEKIQPGISEPVISLNANSKANVANIDKSDTFTYSKFPPIRLGQKLIRFCIYTLDLAILEPVVKIIATIKYQWWKLNGKKVFVSSIDELITQKTTAESIKSLPKNFYAPLKLSTKGMPWYSKIVYHLRYSRPSWYRKYHSYKLAHYLNFGILLIFAAFLGFKMYDTLSKPNHMQTDILGAQQSEARFLSFKGKLTDPSNNPIVKESSIRFSLYNDKTASGASLLWQEVQNIQPDSQGNFETVLGQNYPITQDFLNNNQKLFLGISVGPKEELQPRQQIATSIYTKDSEALQSMLPSTDPNAGTKNIILALDSSGNLVISGHASPRFEATGGEFTLSGQTLTLTTTAGSNSNIQLNPDGSGIIDLQKPIQNTTNYSMFAGLEGMIQMADSLGIITSSATQSALLINQNGIGNIISAGSSTSAKFTLDYLGNATFAGDAYINGNILDSDSYTFGLLNHVFDLTIGASASAISIGATTGATLVNNEIKANGGVFVPDNKNITLGGFKPGSIPFIGNNKEIAQDNSALFWDQSNKRLGLGTIVPSFRLSVEDNQTATAAAQIYNSSTDADADALVLKIGASTASTTNKFISFQTSSGEVGAITGTGLNGIKINTETFADWAEYIEKDRNETIPFGSLVCIKESGKATACDENENKIIGIASENPTIIAGKNLGDGSIAVGLTGLVKTFVTSENGDIKPGDLITYSPTSGIGIKATQRGMVVGRALEGYENSNLNAVGKILVSLQTFWYDPGETLTASGNLIDQPAENNSQLSALNSTLSNILENISAGFLEVDRISTKSLSIATDNITIGSQTLKEYISSIVSQAIESNNQKILADIQKIQSSQTTPIASNAAQLSALNSPLSTQSAVASTSANYIANTNNTYSNISSESAHASESAKIADLGTNQSSPAAIADLYQLSNQFPRFNQGILALGASSLTDVSINGSLYLGSGTILSENSINTIGTDLNLQPLRQGNLSIMGGLIAIDTEGNLSVKGNANFAKNVEIQGALAVNIISPIPNSDLIIKLATTDEKPNTKLAVHNSENKEVLSINNLGDLIASGTGQFKQLAAESLNIIHGAQADTSFTETISSASAGTAVISAYETERTIKTPFVKENSLIYISPLSDTKGITPYVARQTPSTKNSNGSFTIQVSSNITKDIKINWWIIN